MPDGQSQSVEICPLCHSAIHTTQLRQPPYEVRRCSACGLGYVTPRRSAEALQEMYSDESYWRSATPTTYGYHDYRAEQPRYLRSFRKRLTHALAQGPAGGRALDVGAAAGFCMAVLRERGFDTYGVEISPLIAAHAQHELGFGDRLFVGTIDSAPFGAKSFDLITMWDLIAHVPDPVGLLVGARGLLAPGGRLVLGTQDIDSLAARALGPRWRHFKHAEHLYHFTPGSLRLLLSEAGFRVERLTHRHGGRYVSAANTDLYLNLADEMLAVARAQY